MIATPAQSRRSDRHRSSTLPQLDTVFAQSTENLGTHEKLVVRSGARSVAGLYRPRNEDRCVADVERGFFLVVDGVGGHCGGAEASEIVARVLPDWLTEIPECAWRDEEIIESIVAAAVEAARREMIQLAATHADYFNMAATISLALVIERTLCVSRVGDCRAYLQRRGCLQPLTKDQTFAQSALEAGVLTEETARNHVWSHVVTNTVGVQRLDEPITVDLFELSAGDRVLLCSDGLTDVVSDGDLQHLLAREGSSQATADALVDLALDHDSHDNVTCIVVDMSNHEKGADF